MSRIKNIKGLIENAESAGDKFAREIALTLLERVLTEADPKVAMQRALQLEEGELKIQGQVFDLEAYDKIYVIGGGKAGGGMAESVENLLGERISGGWINIPTGTKKRYKTKIIVLNESTHPVPNEAGVKGSKRILEIAQGAGEKDLVIVLLSGGASALIPYPTEGLSLSDMQDITGGLLRSGADIVEVNSVRKHLSKVKGGRLAQACYPATVVSLIISDVVCDPLDVIASGPTAPDPTTYDDASSVLEKYRLTKDYPKITKYLEKGGQGMFSETLKDGDACLPKTHNFLISTNKDVLHTVADEFKDRYDIQIFSTT
ncbi:MAG: glycerate kinase, partial [Candidatus Hydrothermarchaeales archaeon]